MEKMKVIKKGTSIAIINEEGVVEVYSVHTVIALAMQRILGIDKINTSENTFTKAD